MRASTSRARVEVFDEVSSFSFALVFEHELVWGPTPYEHTDKIKRLVHVYPPDHELVKLFADAMVSSE